MLPDLGEVRRWAKLFRPFGTELVANRGCATMSSMCAVAPPHICQQQANVGHRPPTITLAKAIQDIKGNTSKWPNDLGLRFAWQEGYSAFSVSQSQRQRVIDYIDGQAEHHKKWSFEQEFLSLLKKSGIPYDERYVLG